MPSLDRQPICGHKLLSVFLWATLLVANFAAAAPNDPGEGGAWSSVQGWPMIPVSAANLPDGRIVAWASNERTAFPSGPEFTYTAIWDPQTNQFTEIPHPSHDMFCSHHVMLEDGKVFVSGGRNQGNSPWTSVFNHETNTWEVLPNMNRGRWYPTSVMTADGKVMTSIGSGGGNTAEIWDGTSWSLMGGLNFDAPILNYNHGERNWWPIMHLAPDGRIFHSGPTPAMHMIDPTGNGSLEATNTHTDWYPKHGTTVMYAEGKLLTAGGWTSGSALASSARSMTIDLNGPSPVIAEIASMNYPRKFHNGVTLPNGEVLVVGGNTSGAKFNDSGSVLPVEIWNPTTGAWREGASMSVPRNYHSIALLMLDGRVLAGGGGLCNCAADHQDSQIYTPPYLYNADGSPASRPVITQVSGVVEASQVVNVSASPNLAGFSIVKMSSTTHAMNTDLRYLALTSTEASAGEYNVTLPANPNVLTPGYWMLFALNAQGTPSVAKVIQVSTSGTRVGPPVLKNMGNMSSLQSQPLELAVVVSDPDGDALTFSAAGLPTGLVLNPTSGIITGTPTTPGDYSVTLTVSDASDGSDTTSFQWQVTDASNPPGLFYEYYQGDWDLLPDFDALVPVATGTVSNITLAPRQQEDFFGFRFTGRLQVDTAGTYTFYTNSDDGSQLFIGDVLVVDNDGLHAPREASGTATLAAGVHNLRITFFEKGGGANLSASWSAPGISKQLIPDSALRLPAASSAGRYVRLVALSEVNGKPWASAAELNLLDSNGAAYNRSGWVTTATSEETSSDSGVIGNAFDGSAATLWHTEWSIQPGDDLDPAHPHDVIIDMGVNQTVTGLRYLPRAGGGNGTIAQYAIYLSDTPSNWGAPVAQGTFAPGTGEKTVLFATSPPTDNTAPAVTSPGNQSGQLGDVVSLLIQASDADGNTLVFAATDLPSGLTMNSATGLISGTADAIGSHTSTVIVDDGTDSTSVSFGWAVNDVNVAPSIEPVANQAGIVGDSVSLTLVATDANGDQLTFSATGLPGGISIDSASGSISGVLAAAGSFNVVVSVTDGSLSSQTSFAWGVTPANVAPVLNAVPDQNSVVDNAASLALVASDANGDALTFSATGLPVGLSVNTNSGIISGAATTAGTYSVGVAVTDGALTASANFVWVVTAPAEPIVIAPLSMPPQEAGATVDYSASVTGSGPLEYRWSFADGSPAGNFSSNPDVSHSFAAPGRYLVTLEVRNSSESQTTTFTQAVHGPHTTLPGTASSTIIRDSSTGAERVWNVNPDNNSVGVIDTISQSLVAEISVGARPVALASNGSGEIWVSLQDGDAVARISSASLTVVGQLDLERGAAPYGIVNDSVSGNTYVAAEGLESVLVLAANGQVLNTISVGANVRHLSLTGDGSRLLASRFITPLLPGESGASVSTTVNGQPVGGEVLQIDTATNSVVGTTVLAHSSAIISEHSGPGLPNYLRAAVISPDGVTGYVPGKQDNVLAGTLRSSQALSHDHTVRAISSRLNVATGVATLNERIDHDNASIASAAAFDGSGNYLFVALEGNRMVAAVDAYRGEELFRFFSGRAPSGLVVGADGSTLYVHNFMDRTVSIHDLSTLVNTGNNLQSAGATVSVVTNDALSPQLLLGKQHFYDAMDPRLALESYMACASCHNEGDSDGRVWDFTQFGEGVRNTSTLVGQGGAAIGPVHWTGNFDEIQDFEGQIRAFARGLGLMADADFNTGTRSQPLGDPKAGLSPDLDALAAYVDSLASVGVAPGRNADGSLSVQAQAGESLFLANGCLDCHGGNGFTDSALDLRHDVGTLTAASGQRAGAALDGLDTPSLRGLWRTAPYLHDGSAATLEAAIAAHSGSGFSAPELTQVATYVAQLDDDATLPGGTGCSDCLDFNNLETFSYANQDAAANVTVSTDGSAITLTDNTWRRTEFSFTLTPTTVLEFDVQIDQVGEIQGIGFDNDDKISSSRTFKLHGTQNWGRTEFNNYTGGTVHYQIPVGQYYTGSNLALFFANDFDAGSGNQITFSNVRVSQPGGNMPPSLTNPGSQSSRQNSSTSLQLQASDLDGDNLVFEATGLPTGLVLDTATGLITGTPTQVAGYAVAASVNDGAESATVNFSWSITESSASCVDCLDFTSVATESFSNQDGDAQVAVEDNGETLLLTGNTWRRTLQTFTITENTVVEFDFSSTAQGEIHGLGFDEDQRLSSSRLFKVYGTQAYGRSDFDNYSGSGVTTYRIPVGQFYTGQSMHLVFAMDRDSGSGNDSRFSNVRVFEAP